MLKLTDGRRLFTNKQILDIYLQQAQTSGEIFKNYPSSISTIGTNPHALDHAWLVRYSLSSWDSPLNLPQWRSIFYCLKFFLRAKLSHPFEIFMNSQFCKRSSITSWKFYTRLNWVWLTLKCVYTQLWSLLFSNSNIYRIISFLWTRNHIETMKK